MTNPVILVVDDDPQVLAAIRRDLRSHYNAGYRVLAAGSGESALDTIRELKARGAALAMAISDQRMPGMLGVELLAKCREVYPIARRVLLTAYSDIAAAVRGINEARLDHYFEKPWDPPQERLFPLVDDLLDAWRAEYRPEVSGLRLVGHQWSRRSHEIKEFLAGNIIPYRWFEIEHDREAQILLDAAGVGASELPALFLEDGKTLRNPDAAAIASSLGLTRAAAHDVYDLVIVGAGPAGLAAAVYGASEGLRTLLLDARGPGGQAGASSRIENYLGFPAGVSGNELTRRAILQAQRLGAEFHSQVTVSGVMPAAAGKRLQLSDGREIVARSVIAATGMTYREHPADGIAVLNGAGVYYGSANTEAHGCRNRRVVIVGGGNSAGQSAVFLSRYAAEIQIVVRRGELGETMSQYLIDQIASAGNIRVRAHTTVERVEGEGRLERAWFKSLNDEKTTVENVDALFVFIGTRPHSDWFPEAALRNARGFVLTGRDAAAAEGFARFWKESREPMLLETSIAGLFAAGDVRAGAMNRVAAAVGEGSMAVRLAVEYLART